MLRVHWCTQTKLTSFLVVPGIQSNPPFRLQLQPTKFHLRHDWFLSIPSVFHLSSRRSLCQMTRLYKHTIVFAFSLSAWYLDAAYGLGLSFVCAHSACLAFSFLFYVHLFSPAYYSSASKAMRDATMYNDALYRAIPWWKTWDLALPLKIEHFFLVTIDNSPYSDNTFHLNPGIAVHCLPCLRC